MTEKTFQKKPGYYNEFPIFRVINLMKKNIGLQDSCLQTNEIAILYLEEQSLESGNNEIFIKELCSKFKVSLGIRDFEQFKSTLYKSYILQTYNLIEPFFKNINQTYRYYNNFDRDWKTQDDKGKNLDPFNQLLINLPKDKSQELKTYPEYFLFNYYRLVRNSIAHLQDSSNQHERTNEYFNNYIKCNIDFFKDNYEIIAPNSPESINFTDYILYTKSIKYFSNILNDLCFPSIHNLVILAQKDKNLQSKLNMTKTIKSDGMLLVRINTLRGFFHGHFNTNYKKIRDEFCKAYLEDEKVDCSKFL
ncbi:hypothetical protein EG346_10045 [Chryseobacterium carnipullorum]|uniref:Uncharacterized protein n=1 Tax=Chryseobacterium carnipullorum TaxID=1124835 RepID=A0A376DPC1_CHRCU|nr:hypothetical protein [Chryseobacterium carnipullorum]AZA48505.1 hypothetical protein EG346_10045 [Chryseobacterium carnipullorum]AZA63431.1 hypothetical protein EG345_00945 [Chryseobacterium carnipullorum]STC92511.1 Uncharacterised protein [Chryseobacterium carnipullorum]